MRERMLAGDLYIADDPQLAVDGMRAAKLTHQCDTEAPDDPTTWAALRELLGSFGEGAFVKPPLWCDYGYQIHIVARTFVA